MEIEGIIPRLSFVCKCGYCAASRESLIRHIWVNRCIPAEAFLRFRLTKFDITTDSSEIDKWQKLTSYSPMVIDTR